MVSPCFLRKKKIDDMKKIVILLVMSVMASSMLFAQTAKGSFKAGKTFCKASNYSDAVNQFTKAIELDPSYAEAYAARAEAYVMTEEFELAAKDYERAAQLDMGEAEYAFSAGSMNYKLENYQQAVNNLRMGLAEDSRNLDAYNYLVLSLIELDRIQEAITEANKALNVKKNSQNYINRGMVNYLSANYIKSEEDFRKAIKSDKESVIAHIGLSNSLYKQGKLTQALGVANAILEIDASSKDAYLIRAQINIDNKEYVEAINDASRIIMLYGNDADIWKVYLIRAKSKREFTQYTGAITDYDKVLEVQPENLAALYERAICYEEISQKSMAADGFEQYLAVSIPLGLEDEVVRTEAAKRKVIELRHENDKPNIVVTEPLFNEAGALMILEGSDVVTVKGRIEDASAIENLQLNGVDFSQLTGRFDKDAKTFEFQVPAQNLVQLVFSAKDSYQNVGSNTFFVAYVEENAPTILIFDPPTSDLNEVFLMNSDGALMVKGQIEDESNIRSIFFDGVSASFNPKLDNPEFTAVLDVSNKSTVVLEVEDIYGNKTTKSLILKRNQVMNSEENPMGFTWVVFIENSDYESFNNLTGPKKDVDLMKDAFANYRISNVLHKKNMSKERLDKFFRIELRDMVKKYKVNSLLVWYAGHGAFMNETGYWIPVDADRDDEFSYYDLNALRASMESYVDDIDHLLVISDACESGPSFYLAMRDAGSEKTCENWELTKSKSAQVLSSAGYELAADNSVFALTIAGMLDDNPNHCLPIDKVAEKVIQVVTDNNDQRPQFGNIRGFVHEGGTFFFVRK